MKSLQYLEEQKRTPAGDPAPEIIITSPQEANAAHLHLRALPLGQKLLLEAIAIGRYLTKAKAEAGRGHWLKWIEDNLDFACGTAWNYRNLYQSQDLLLNEPGRSCRGIVFLSRQYQLNLPKFLNQAGRIVGRLTVSEQFEHRRDKHGHSHVVWLCKCQCGNQIWLRAGSLGRTLSCGCLRQRHGHSRTPTSRTPTYQTWSGMLQRCGNRKQIEAHRYIKRGITVCDRWRHFEAFLEDMGERPTGMTLERKNNNLGYTPENCEWADRFKQARNTCRTKLTFEAAVQVALRALRGDSYRAIARDYAISRNMVYLIVRGFSWKDAGTEARRRFQGLASNG